MATPSVVLAGTSLRDTLIADADSIVRPDAGDDDIRVTAGATEVVLERGFGTDVVLATPDAYVAQARFSLRFGEGLLPSDLDISREDTDSFWGGQTLRLRFRSTGDTLVVPSPFTLPRPPIDRLPTSITFADGTFWSADEVGIQVARAVQTGPFIEAVGDASQRLEVVNRGPHSVRGGAGDDTLVAGTGADHLSGLGGYDTYFFKGDWGTDNGLTLVQNFDTSQDHPPYPVGPQTVQSVGAGWVTVTASRGRLLFDADTPLSEVQFATAGSDLLIRRTQGSGGIRVTQYFDGIGTPAAAPIVTIEFADGQILTRADLEARLWPDTEAGVERSGGTSSERFLGGAGADTFFGGAGGDRYEGGAGNDVFADFVMGPIRADYYGYFQVRQGGGDDTYVFRRGGGVDTVYDYGGFDTLEFGEGITPDDIELQYLDVVLGSNGVPNSYTTSRQWVLALRDSDDRVIFGEHGFTPNGRTHRSLTQGIERVLFADGQAWDTATLTRMQSEAQMLSSQVPGYQTVPTERADLSVTLGSGDGEGTVFGDWLYAGAQTAVVHGGPGDDRILGPGRAQGVTVLWNRGDGSDVIDVPGVTLALGAQVKREDVQFLELDEATGRARIAMDPARTRDVLTVSSLQTLRFADDAPGSVGLSGAALGAFARQSPSLRLNVVGTSDDDVLLGGAGADTLRGRAGSDTLVGEAGADTLIFAPGDGADVVRADSQDVLVLSHLEDLHVGNLGATGSGRVVLDLGGGDSLTLERAGEWDGLQVRLAGERQLSGAEIMATARLMGDLTLDGSSRNDSLVGGAGYDRLSGLAGHDRLRGLGGHDRLDGGAGRDTLVGGLGQDTLLGGKGADTYQVVRGDGQDLIVDTDSTWLTNDVLAFGDVRSDQLWFTQDGDDLRIAIIGSTDVVTVQDWYLGSAHRIETIRAAGDGRSLGAGKVNALVTAMAGFTDVAMADTQLPADTPANVLQAIRRNWV